MWVLTFKTLSGPVRSFSKIFCTRFEALSGARKLKDFSAQKTNDAQYIAGTGSLHGIAYTWSVEMAAI